MIESLDGILARKSPLAAVVEVGGVGFQLNVPLSTFRALPRPGARVHLLTHLHVREDQLTLYGFATEQERRLFRMLLGVNRIGPGLALQVLSSCSVEEFSRLVEQGDAAALASMVRGVGKKTAQRLVLELRGELAGAAGEEATEAASQAASDAVKALVSLGESPASARRTVRRALRKLGPEVDAETLMREVLSS